MNFLTTINTTLKLHDPPKFRCLMVWTNQADPIRFYFRISWILMEQRWFNFFLSPSFSAGPQKPPTLTASKIKFSWRVTFGQIQKAKMKLFLVPGQSQFSFTSGWLGSYWYVSDCGFNHRSLNSRRFYAKRAKMVFNFSDFF